MDLFKNYIPSIENAYKLKGIIQENKDYNISNIIGMEVFNIEGLKYSHKNTILGFSNRNPVMYSYYINNSKNEKRKNNQKR